MPRITAAIATAALLASLPVPRAARAQGNEYAAAVALSVTPPGSLVPIAVGSRVSGPWNVVLRYGRVSRSRERATHLGGLTLDYGLAGGRGAVTVGAIVCEHCDALVNAAFDYERVIATTTPQAGEITLSVKPALGYGRITGGARVSFMSGSLGLPVALRSTTPAADLSVMPYVVPAIGAGAVVGDEGGSDGGLRPMLGGGLRLDWSKRQTSLFGGFQKVFVEGSEVIFGVGLSVNAGNPL